MAIYDNVIQVSKVEQLSWFQLLQIHVPQRNVYYLIMHVLGNMWHLVFPLYLFLNDEELILKLREVGAFRIHSLWFSSSDRGFTVFLAFLPLLPISLFCPCCPLLFWKTMLVCVVCPCICLSASQKLVYHLCLSTSVLWSS